MKLPFAILVLVCITLGVACPTSSVPASIGPSEPESLSVVRVDGSSSSYTKVQPRSDGFLRATRGDGRIDFIPLHEVRAIRGPGRTDLTERVLVDRRDVGPRPAPPTAPTEPSNAQRVPLAVLPFQDSTLFGSVGAESIAVVTEVAIAKFIGVEPWPNGYVRAIHEDGSVEYIPAHQVRWIVNHRREDLTSAVLDRGSAVGSLSGGTGDVRGAPALRGRPLPWRRGFPLIQGGVLSGSQGSIAFITDVGFMHNISAKNALGATISLVGDEDYTRVGIKPRIRDWVNRTTSFDFAAGPFYSLDDPDDDLRHTGLGFAGEATVTFGDWVGFTTLMEISKFDEYFYAPYPKVIHDSGTEVAFYLGIKVGGELGIPGSILAGLFATALPQLSEGQ